MNLNLRTYQKDAIGKIQESLSNDKYKKIGVFMPTGSGKTVVFTAFLEHYFKNLPPSSRNSVLILSHKSDLVEQTVNFINTNTKIVASKLQGQLMPSLLSRIIVSTMQSSKDANKIERFKRYSINNDISLIIIDECHYAPVATYQQIFDLLPDAKIIGFTATPWRKRYVMSNWFDHIAYNLSLGDLIEEGVLLKPNLITISYNTGVIEERIESCIKIVSENSDKSGVIYCTTIDEANGFRNAFVSLGFNAAVITSETQKPTRNRILEEYREGKIKLLINVNVLTEGIDAPIAQYLIMPFGTNSPTVFQQRVGRLLRKHADQKDAYIYIYGDTPSIAKGFYQKILNAALKDGSKDPLKRNDVFDDLEWLQCSEEKDTQKIEWTENYCNIITKLRKKGLNDFASLLQHKKFPPKYLKNIIDFKNNIKNHTDHDGYVRVITNKQIEILESKGFSRSDVANLSIHDASSIIASIFSWENRFGEFSVKFGRFKGKHVSEIPGPYLKWLKAKNKTHPIFALIANWNKLKSIEVSNVSESSDLNQSIQT